MKKILSGLLLILLCFPTVWAGSYVSPEYSYARMQLMQTPYKKYVAELEAAIPNLSYKKLEEIYERSSSLENSNPEVQKLIDFIEELSYLYLSKENEVPNLAPNLPQDNQDKTELLSNGEKDTAQKEIQILQNIMQEELLDLMDTMMISFEKMQNYEQKGDMDISFAMNIPELMEYNFGINFEDYISRNVGFDSSFESDFSVNAQLKSSYEDFEGEFAGNIDLISKGGDVYIKADDISLNASELFEEEFAEVLEKINQLGENNTYLHISDETSEYLITSLESLSMQELEREIKEISTMNLFEAYEKNEDAYLLRPTQEMCSLMKEALSVFDPFGGKTCSQGQYEDMLEDFTESGLTLSLTPGNTKTLTLEIDDTSVQGQVKIEYSNYGVIGVIGEIYEPGNSDINNIRFSYIPGESLSFDMKMEEMLRADIVIKLSRNKELQSIESEISYSDEDDALIFIGNYDSSALEMKLNGMFEGMNFDCHLDGDARNTRGDLEGTCNISGENYFGELENYESEYSFSYDLRNGRNNMDMEFIFAGSNDMSLDMQLKNTGTIKYSTIDEIIAPSKTKDFVEFMEEMNSYENYYDDSSYSDYEVITTQHSDYSETCYNYSNGDYSCTKYYDDDSVEYCSFYTAFDEEEYCTTY